MVIIVEFLTDRAISSSENALHQKGLLAHGATTLMDVYRVEEQSGLGRLSSMKSS